MIETNILERFHPLVQRWFAERFAAPTDAQRLGWPAILGGQDALIAAPTGSGKTLTAFLASLDRLVRLALAGELRDQTYVVYVSPLRALSNDIQRNLEAPLAEILDLAREQQSDCPEIRAAVRTGDTSPGERQRMVRRPPHILVTTPESLYLLLTGKKSREILRSVDTVIVDEIHALARDKRGSHLALSLERLDALCRKRPVRIGLSATQKPMDQIAAFLSGSGRPSPTLVDIGHVRELDLAVEVPLGELQAVCSHEQWAEIYELLVEEINRHQSTLIFVNTRKLAERVTHQLTQRLGEDQVLSHHGSLSHTSRRRTEQSFKEGRLKAVVATASLELGIDIGHIDLVCQLGSPRSIATFLQRIGRAGHSLGLVPKGRLFALSREELIENLALVRAVREGHLDRVQMPQCPLDILAQQITAALACDEWGEDALFDLCRRAYPFRSLTRADYEAVLEMLSGGLAPARGRYGAHVHRDRVNRRLRARKGARLTAITCGGAIPEVADYRVVMDDEKRTFVGTLNEDFAIESNAGDIFLLGNTSWRVRYVRGGEVVVSDAHGAPPTIPFWLGEAPGRTIELSAEVARLRQDLADFAARGREGRDQAIGWLMETCRVSQYGADQAISYVAAQHSAAGMVPTQKRVLFERFFDESGGMQLVVHAPFGTRINRAWGLALRKRFCRTFDFELQAAADDNGIVLSLGAQHSFPLDQMFRLVPSHVARDVLVQAFLAVPFFITRWRWNVTRALQLKRWQKGRRVPPNLQRMRADDLLSAVFPAQTACQEHVVGDIQIPDHPLVRQTVDDCLHEAADLEGLIGVLRDLESGQIEVVGLDSREPSPFAHELLNSNLYSFLDDAPLEERRARAVAVRRTLSSEALNDLGWLNPEAIAQVKSEAWPLVRDGDELHDVLLSMGVLTTGDGRDWQPWFDELRSAGRATIIERTSGPPLWTATEQLPLVSAIWNDAKPRPQVAVPVGVRRNWTREEALLHVVRGRIECAGPTTADAIAAELGLSRGDVEAALAGLETQGAVLRGRFTRTADEEWCDRRLLARIHRLTLDGLRQQIAPVAPEQFVQMLVEHQNLAIGSKLDGQAGLLALIEQLEGFEAPAGHWERYLLPSRLASFDSGWLDNLTFSGRVGWGRIRVPSPPSAEKPARRGRPMKPLRRSTPITLMLQEHATWLLPEVDPTDEILAGSGLGAHARDAFDALLRHGAVFPAQLGSLLELLPSQVEDALGELAAAGLVTSDGYASLRTLIASSSKRMGRHRRLRKPNRSHPPGRWTLLRSPLARPASSETRLENWCRLLLRRYGVVFRDLLAGEPAAPAWHQLVRTYRRLEARGEVRGGRFVRGVSGEQFALAEVIPVLRAANDRQQAPLILPATDPLNVSGRVTQSERVPAGPGHWIQVVVGEISRHDRTQRTAVTHLAQPVPPGTMA